MTSEVFNTDCLEYMRTLPDKAFQLAIADPPYGIGEDGKSNHSRGCLAKSQEYTPKDWDSKAPDKEFFNELFRVCRNVIIWGANHFIENLPRQNASCWLLWDKKFSDGVDFSQFEMAWTSFDGMTKKFDKSPTTGEYKFHPTQKPVELYAWILKHYGNQGDRIFDPMMGSQSSRIAAYKLGFDYVGCELDKEYFDKGCERFDRECHGIVIDSKGQKIQQQTLF